MFYYGKLLFKALKTAEYGLSQNIIILSDHKSDSQDVEGQHSHNNDQEMTFQLGEAKL